MKVLLTIWISAVLTQEVIPSTLVRLPRLAPNKTSLIHTEYEAKYGQKGKHGNESFSSVSGKQHFMHDNCSENWNAFAEKCASLIKDLVASLANVVTSKPGDATNLQLHIKNTFRHFDNTHNCTCLNHTGQGLSDIDLSSLFNNITINTVGPATNDGGGSGSRNNNVLQNNCGGDGLSCDEENGSPLKPVVVSPASNSNGSDNSEPDHNQSQKCSDESCAGHDNNVEKGTEGQASGDPAEVPPKRRISNALIDSENPQMHPSTAGNSNDQSTNNNRRQAKYPQVSRQPENLIYSPDDSDYLIYPKEGKGGKQILYPFLVTPRPSYPVKSPEASVDPTSASGNSPDVNPLSLPEDKSSGRTLVSPVSSLNKGNDAPSFASHLATSPGNSYTSPNLTFNLKNAAPNQPTQTEMTSPIVTPINNVAGNENQPSLVAQTGPRTENHNTKSAVPVPVETNGYNSEPPVVAPVKKTEPLTMIPVINSNSNLPESSVPENEDVKSVNPSPTYEPLPTGPSPNPSSKVVIGKNPGIIPPEEDPPSDTNNENGVPGGSGNFGEPTSNQGTIPVAPVPGFPLNSATGQPTYTLQNKPQYPQTITGNYPAKSQEQPNQEALIVTPTPVKTVTEAPVIDQHTAEGPGNIGCTGDPYAKNTNNWAPTGSNIPVTSEGSGKQRNRAVPVEEAAATTPYFIYPVKPLSASTPQSNIGSVDPDGENQQPQVNSLTTPIPLNPMKTIPAIPADTDQLQGANPTDSLGNYQQEDPFIMHELYNEFPHVTETPKSSGQQDCNGCKDPSTNNLGTDNPGTESTNTKAEDGAIPEVLQGVKPVVFSNSQAQAGGTPLEHSSVPSGESDPVGQGANPVDLTPLQSDPDVIPRALEPVKPTVVPDFEPQTGIGNTPVPSDQFGQGATPVVWTHSPSGPDVIPTVLQSVPPAAVPESDSQTGIGDPSGPSNQSGQVDPLGVSGQSGEGALPVGLTPAQSGHHPAITELTHPVATVPTGPGQGDPSGPSTATGPLGHLNKEAIPAFLKPTQPENGVTPANYERVGLVPNGKEQSGNDAGDENPVLIRPTTFQTTSVEPTAPPIFPIKSTKPISDALVPQDSYETLPVKPSTSPKTPAPHDDDDDDDCCSCESCTEEEITDPKEFKENACRNLEEARKELKQIFDKIKKKLKCGRKAPQTITTQRIS